MSPECLSHNVLNPFPIAGQLGHFQLFIVTNKICFLATFVPLKGNAAHLGGKVHLQVVSTCLWRLKKHHNHSFGLIRSQAEPFIVWRQGELERRRFTLEPSFYFKVYLCEERQFIALFLKNSWPLLSLVLEGICSWQWGQREGFGYNPRSTVREEGAFAEANWVLFESQELLACHLGMNQKCNVWAW